MRLIQITLYSVVLVTYSGLLGSFCFGMSIRDCLDTKFIEIKASTSRWINPIYGKGPWVERANQFISTLNNPRKIPGPPESVALQRVGVILKSRTKLSGRLVKDGDETFLLLANKGKGRKFDGIEYVEFPNSSMIQTADPKNGKTRTFLVTRGVRRYKTRVDLENGSISPQGYVSDVLLFELVNGKAIFRHRLLTSLPQKMFFFEDPRISVIYDKEGQPHYYLSGTDYSPHVPGRTDPDVMNRYVELVLDKRGVPQPPKIGKDGKPAFRDLSAKPESIPGTDDYVFVDAKNATITQNEQGQIVVRTRIRPDFPNPSVAAMAKGEEWKYAEQVFVFKNMDEFQRYDWNNALPDLFGTASGAKNRVRPVIAKTLLKDKDIREFYRGSAILAEKGKGMGPGSPPVRVQRKGKQIWVSLDKNAPAFLAGEIGDESFGLADGEVTYLTFDHEIRYFEDKRGDSSFLERNYSLSIKKFDPSLTKIQAYYADAIQPSNSWELGGGTAIADLQHAYVMGRGIVADAKGHARILLSIGVSDAHTELINVDVMELLREMSPGSSRWKSGQVYRPGS